ncbi:hypothetical protein H2248_000145 [Termitomyces sp. 'cryptogamus']|nr:hypothetical protein H2248_000145 [Termitomyces sp. 'cryptogamus']
MSPPTGPKNPVSSDPYSLLENSVYRDKTQRIKGIRHYPAFVSAITRLAEEAKAKGSPVLVARHVGAAELTSPISSTFLNNRASTKPYTAFRNSSIAALHSLLPLSRIGEKLPTEPPKRLKNVLRFALHFSSRLYSDASQTRRRDDARKARERRQERDSDVEMMKMQINELFTRFSLFSLSHQHVPEAAPEAKKPRLHPSVASYRPDGSCAQALLDETDRILAKDGKVSRSTLRDYAQALDQTACQQLFALDIAQQLCKQLIARREAVRTALDDHDIADTGILIRDLQVASDSQLPVITENSSIEVSGTDPKADEVANAIEATL